MNRTNRIVMGALLAVVVLGGTGFLFYYLFFSARNILIDDVQKSEIQEQAVVDKDKAIRDEKLRLIAGGSDLTTFQFLGNGTYGKDKDSVFYFYGDPINYNTLPDADSGSFETLNEFFSKDDNYVYFLGEIVPDLDPDTVVVGDGYIADDDTVYVVDDSGDDPIITETEDIPDDSGSGGDDPYDPAEDGEVGGSSPDDPGDGGGSGDDDDIFEYEDPIDPNEAAKILDGTFEGVWCGEEGGEREYCVTSPEEEEEQ